MQKHLSRKKEKKLKQKAQKAQPVTKLLPKRKKEATLKPLVLERVKAEGNPLKEALLIVHSPKEEKFFENLITIEELAVIFRLAPQTIRNWIALGKIPYVRIGRRSFFQKRSLQKWLNRKEEPQWQ